MRTEKISIRHFTENEKQFAEKNHDVVYRFLNMNHYSIEDYYNIVIMDFLQAVQKWFDRPELHQKCNFQTVAFFGMRRAVFNHNRANGTLKRKANTEALSLDWTVDENGNSLSDIIPNQERNVLENMVLVETDMEFLMEIFGLVTEIQKSIIIRLLDGFNEMEIYRDLGIRRSEYRKELDSIRLILLER